MFDDYSSNSDQNFALREDGRRFPDGYTHLVLAEESVQSPAELREVLAVRLDRVVDVVLNELGIR